jgi:hypothetical protein
MFRHVYGLFRTLGQLLQLSLLAAGLPLVPHRWPSNTTAPPKPAARAAGFIGHRTSLTTLVGQGRPRAVLWGRRHCKDLLRG